MSAAPAARSRAARRDEAAQRVSAKSLAESEASQLLHQTDDVIGRIEHAQELFDVLANLSPTDPTQQKFAVATRTYIGNHLLDAPALLNRRLSPSLAIGDNVLKATSRALAASNRFFDQRDSREVKSVYDYFATFQAQLAVLRSVKRALDPNNILNPGKVLDF